MLGPTARRWLGVYVAKSHLEGNRFSGPVAECISGGGPPRFNHSVYYIKRARTSWSQRSPLSGYVFDKYKTKVVFAAVGGGREGA